MLAFTDPRATDAPLRMGAGDAWRALLRYDAAVPRTMQASAYLPPHTRADAEATRAERDLRLAALLDQSVHGSSTAFEQFFDATAAYARALARRMLSGADIDDLLSEAYFEAWRKAARFDAGRGSAVTWLLQIVRSRALDMLREQARRPLSDAGEHEHAEAADPESHAADAADGLWRQQAATHLHAALLTLTAAERWVLGLAYFRDLSHSEIATATGLPLGTVKSHVQRAQTKLRAALQD